MSALLLAIAGLASCSSAPVELVERAPDPDPKRDAAPNDVHRNVQAARIRVHYPAGAYALSLAVEGTPSTPIPPLTHTTNDTWELTVDDLAAPLSFRPMRNGRAAKGAPYRLEPGRTLDVYPWFDRDCGALSGFEGNFESRILNNVRGVRMYTPPSYRENTLKRYPVIYMHDGQVIFDADMALEDGLAKQSFGSWKLEKVMNAEIAAGHIPEAIVIGIDIVLELNLSDPTRQRTREMTPTPDDAFVGFRGTGQGPQYLRMITEELRPAINQRLRTLPDREHTFLMGSSLGGLINVWAGMYHGATFSAIASLSTASYWDKEVVVTRANSLTIGPTTATRIYLDVGQDERESEGDPNLSSWMPNAEQQARLEAALVHMGYVKDQTLKTVVDPTGKHHGTSWNKRAPIALSFLLGSGP